MFVLIVAILLVLFFGFLAYMAYQTWTIPQVLLLFAVFLASMVFVGLSAMSLKTRVVWQQTYEQLAQELETTEQQLALLSQGPLLSGDEPVDSVRALEGRLSRLLLDRGRVWRGVVPVNAAEGGIVLSLAQWGNDACARVGQEEDVEQPLEPMEDPAADAQPGEAVAQPAGKPHGIESGMVLYAFVESSVTALGEPAQQALFGASDLAERDSRGVCRVPVFYLGDFRVTAGDEQQITVVPELPPDERQAQAMQAGGNSWVLYEIMPVDSHTAFEGVTEEMLRALFPSVPDGEQLVGEYARNLQPALASDPPERTRRKVRFLQDYEVDVDVAEAAEEGADRSFDPDGRAVLAQLRQGEPTVFQASGADSVELVWLDGVTANQLQQEGVVAFADEPPIYVRPLRNYAHYFSEKFAQAQGLDRQMRVLQSDNQTLVDSAGKSQEQIAFRREEIEKLNQDSAQVAAETGVLETHAAGLRQEQERQKTALSSFYRWNSQVADELRGGAVFDTRRRAR